MRSTSSRATRCPQPPGFYHAKGGKGVYLYGGASWTSQIIGAMSSAGISRGSYKLISAHYMAPTMRPRLVRLPAG